MDLSIAIIYNNIDGAVDYYVKNSDREKFNYHMWYLKMLNSFNGSSVEAERRESWGELPHWVCVRVRKEQEALICWK